MIIHREDVGLMNIPLASGGNVTCPKALKEIGKGYLTLTPGYNEIPDVAWNEIVEKFPAVKREIEFGKIKEYKPEIKEKTVGKGDKKKKVKEKKGKEFKDLTVAEAKKVISDTNNIKALEKFAEKEERADIRNTIKDRIEEIKSAGEKKK
jgi:hypothetical protein